MEELNNTTRNILNVIVIALVAIDAFIAFVLIPMKDRRRETRS